MEILKYKDYEGTAELDMARGVCRGKLLFIDDVVTYETISPLNLQHEFELAVEDYLDTCTQLGREAQRPCRGQFNVRISPSLHKSAVLRAMAEDVSLNEIVSRAMDAYINSRVEVINTTHNTYVINQSQKPVQEFVSVSASKPAQWRGSSAH